MKGATESSPLFRGRRTFSAGRLAHRTGGTRNSPQVKLHRLRRRHRRRRHTDHGMSRPRSAGIVAEKATSPP